MATYYISSAATNGYVVGSNSNNGLSKAAPFLNLDAPNDNGFTWSGNDTFYINGDMVCSTILTFDDTSTWIGEAGTRPVITLRSVTSGLYGSDITAGGKTITLRHLHFKAGSVTEALLNAKPATLSTIVMTDCRTEANVIHYQAGDGEKPVAWTITSCEAYSAALADAVLNFAYCPTATVLTINGLLLDITTAGTGARTLLTVSTTTAQAATCSISGVTGDVNGNSLTSGALTGIATSRVNGVVIENCDLNLLNTQTGVTCTLYKIGSVAATHVLTSGYIRNNRGSVASKGGLLIIAGADGGAYNGADGIQIYGNDVSGPVDATTLHGIMLGGNKTSHAYNNRVRYTQIPLIAKDSENCTFSHNIVEYVVAGGQAMRCKGATDAVFAGNLHVIHPGAWNAYSVYVDDSTVDGNSTGCLFYGNAQYAHLGATEQNYIVFVAPSQTATFFANNWYDAKGLAAGGQFNSIAGNRLTLANWNALAYVTDDVSFSTNVVPKYRESLQDMRIPGRAGDVYALRVWGDGTWEALDSQGETQVRGLLADVWSWLQS